MLSEAGIGHRRIAELADVSYRTLARVLYEGKRLHAATADRVLAISPAATPAMWGAPAVGIVRRLRALRADGRNNTVLAAAVGVDRNNLSQITLGYREQVVRSTAAAVRDLYAMLADQPPEPTAFVRRTIQEARLSGWFRPGAWDPETIDDPDAPPCLLPPVAPVDRDLELLVQHIVAGHPAKVTRQARYELIRRMPDRPSGEIAVIAQCSVQNVSGIRRLIADRAAREAGEAA